jgi:hypothetical protein
MISDSDGNFVVRLGCLINFLLKIAMVSHEVWFILFNILIMKNLWFLEYQVKKMATVLKKYGANATSVF